MFWLAWLQRAKPIQNSDVNKLENELAAVKTQYDTLETYIKSVRTEISKSNLKAATKESSNSKKP